MKKLVLVLLALLCATPTMAVVDFDLYGDIHLGMWWDQRERWYEDTVEININGNDTSVVLGADSLPVYQNSWVPHGKFGFKIKGDRITGCVEMGLKKNVYDATLSGATGMKYLKREAIFFYMRKWFGQIQFSDMFSLLLGQDYAVVNHLISEQAFYDKNSLTNLGCTYTGRSPMIRADLGGELSTSVNLKGQLAIIKPDTVIIGFRGNELESEVETKAPKVEAGAEFNLESGIFGLRAKGACGFQRFYSLLRTDPSIPKDSIRVPINCFVLSGDAGFKIGPVYLDGTFSLSQNPGAYSIAVGNRWEWRGSGTDPKTRDIYLPYYQVILDDQTGEVIGYELRNATMVQYAGVIKVKPTDFLYFEAGYGFQTVTHTYNEFQNLWSDRDAGYFQATVTLFETFNLTPEIGFFRWGDEYRKGGRFRYLGLGANFEF